mgnify:CR=1 FL=1
MNAVTVEQIVMLSASALLIIGFGLEFVEECVPNSLVPRRTRASGSTDAAWIRNFFAAANLVFFCEILEPVGEQRARSGCD